ncbi:MAG TPA: quinone oxidoreductase [Acidobacteriaceae bacterium]|nr:quinone oxidoreductase [Acidobacteriaceae bacterium]
MKAIQISQTGGPEVLRLAEISRPSPTKDQVLVQVHRAGVNFIDIYYREGVYKAPLPMVPGMEGAGTVVEVGENVRDFHPGDRVAWCMAVGAYAEYAAIPESNLVHIPGGVTFEQAAAILLQGMSAQYLTTSTFPLHSGDTVLLHAGAGGVGLLLTQMAARIGAHVISTVSTADKVKLARAAGARDVILYTEEDFESAVKRITGGRGVDVVYDSVGKTTFESSLKCLRPRGMLVLFGASSGPVPPFDLIQLSTLGSLFITRPTLRDYASTRAELDERSGDVFERLQRGDLSLRIHRSFPLEQAAQAQEKLQSRHSTGKILLVF